MKILIAGLPGSGKTTQARLLSKKLNLPFVGMGDVLREVAEEDSDLGKLVKRTIVVGELLEDSLTAKIIEEKLSTKDFEKGYIIDGYPRSVEQLSFFDPRYDTVFYLRVSLKEGLKRLLHRHRSDDIEDIIRKRQIIQSRKLNALLDYLKGQYKFIEINGEESIEKIHQNIIEAVE